MSDDGNEAAANDINEEEEEEDGGLNNVESPAENEDEDGDDEDEDDLTEFDRYWPPPIDKSVELVASYSSKTVSAFTFNNAGSRFSAGGYDHGMRIWDFGALDSGRPESICNTQPCGQTIVKNLDYSNDDELILVTPSSCQAVVVAKDGLVAKQFQMPKGDQYISDMSNTKGHVQMLNYGCWNPKDKSNFITCSDDGTIRIWDLNKLNQQKTVIKTRSPASGLKSKPNICRFTRDALSIATGCNDGSIMMWDTRRKFISTSACIKNAHLKGSEITGMDFSYGPSKICSRSEDSSCKVWDSRKLKEPLASRTDLNTLHSTTDCSFSPDDKFIITGTSNTKQEPGRLHFLDTDDLTTKSSIETPQASVIRSRWHPKINHIGYSCSNGSVFVVYDTKRSMGGFLASELTVGKGLKRKKYTCQTGSSASDSSVAKNIITPHALPLFRQDQSGSSSFAKIRQDPKRSYKPEMPITGASQGGRVRPAGSTLSSYIAKNIAKPVDDGNGMDIRERILRHAEAAEREPFWVKPSVQVESQVQKQKQDKQE